MDESERLVFHDILKPSKHWAGKQNLFVLGRLGATEFTTLRRKADPLSRVTKRLSRDEVSDKSFDRGARRLSKFRKNF